MKLLTVFQMVFNGSVAANKLHITALTFAGIDKLVVRNPTILVATFLAGRR